MSMSPGICNLAGSSRGSSLSWKDTFVIGLIQAALGSNCVWNLRLEGGPCRGYSLWPDFCFQTTQRENILFMPVLIISGSASQVLHPSYKKKKMKSSEFTTVPFFKSRSPQAVCLFLLSWLHIELFPLYLVIFLGEKRKTEPNISFLKNKYSF